MSGNTLERIQREIKENVERESELRKLYGSEKVQNNEESNNNKIISNGSTNGFTNGTVVKEDVKIKKNGIRLFAQNTSTRGLMKNFFKTRGKLNSAINITSPSNNYQSWLPPSVTIEKGPPVRKGYVSAQEKMKQELQDYTEREKELRMQRIKSNPNIMAALNLEDENYEESSHNENGNFFKLKSAKSMSNLYSESENSSVENNSAPSSLKPARSTILLCDMSEYKDEIPGTHNLIRQFESLTSQDRS